MMNYTRNRRLQKRPKPLFENGLFCQKFCHMYFASILSVE